MTQSVLLIAVIAVMTAFIRFLPFLLFKNESSTPKALEYLGAVLPGAVMGMLVIYCFKSLTPGIYPFAIPELIATVIVVGLYLWRKNVLLSIFSGTVVYMLLVQLVFV